MNVSYKDNDPKGWCGDPKRGAAMGRNDCHAENRKTPLKFYLRKVRLDSGGYDSNGTYFGTGDPLYWYADEDGNVDAVLRLDSSFHTIKGERASAKFKIRGKYPNARFYR